MMGGDVTNRGAKLSGETRVRQAFKALEQIPNDHPVRKLGLTHENLRDAYKKNSEEAIRRFHKYAMTAATNLWRRDHLVSLDWRAFEDLVSILYRARGHDVRCTGGGADGGVDIYAGHGDHLKAIEAKHRTRDGSVGRPIVQKTASHLLRDQVEEVTVVTSGRFTSDAMAYAAAAGDAVSLVSGDDVLATASILGIPRKVDA